VAKAKAKTLGLNEQLIEFNTSSAEEFSTIESNSIDLYVISFGLRNVPDIPRALKEANRVLKKGGRFLCLEFSKVQNPVFSQIYKFYSFNVIPMMGKIVAGDKDSY
jgi:ubiquinone/menaquinone biosynthesis C-methylase UbiE